MVRVVAGKKLLLRRFIRRVNAAINPSWRSTAERFQKNLPAASCSVTKKDRSLVPSHRKQEALSSPMEEPSSWMRSPTFLTTYRFHFSVSFRRERCDV